MKQLFRRALTKVLLKPFCCLLFTTLILVTSAKADIIQNVKVLSSSDDTWPFAFAASSKNVGEINNENVVGLCNSHIGLLIRKKDATILGIWSSKGWNIVDNENAGTVPPQAIWSLELMPKDASKPLGANALHVDSINYDFEENRGTATLRMTFAPVQAGASKCAVTAFVSLSPDDEFLRWRINARMLDGASSVWSVRYPWVQVRAADSDPQANHLVIPYRRGRLDQYGKSVPRYDLVYPYPGAGVKFQFLAAYGDHTRKGFYIAAQDADGYDKQLAWGNYQDRNTVMFAFEHIPANRGVAGTSFQQPYDVVTRPFTGDWYDAARIYRQWWTQQVWASKGLLRDRKDIPEWLKKAQVMTRPSTTQTERTVAGNIQGELGLQKMLNGDALAGIWYGVYENISGKEGLGYSGHGHVRPVRADVQAAIAQLNAQNIHHLAYLQSSIYMPLDSDPKDAAMALKYAAKDRDGKPVMYGDLGLNMDRSTAWWQDRLIEQAKKAMSAGFIGIYLDSFGKSSAECFAPDHGHPIGGGNTGIAGQREMAQRMLTAIRKINPDAVLSGEDPVEAFRDLVQVNLFSANVWPGYNPLYRVIWGDYSLGYGRVLAPSKAGSDNIIPEMAALFINGQMMGRVYTNGDTIFSKPEYAEEKTALQQMAAYGKAGVEYLRFGEYLHPLEWNEPMPTVTIQDSVQNSKVTLPAVMQSVTRSYVDGSVGIALVNISKAPIQLQVPIDPSLRNGKSAKNREATLWRMDASGKRTKLAQGAASWHQPLSLKSHEIAFLILQ